MAVATRSIVFFIIAMIPATAYEVGILGALEESGSFSSFCIFVLTVLAAYSFSVRNYEALFALNVMDLCLLSGFLFVVVPALRSFIALVLPPRKSPAQPSEALSPWFTQRPFAFFLSAVLVGSGIFPAHYVLMERLAYGAEVPLFRLLLFFALLWILAIGVSAAFAMLRFCTAESDTQSATFAIAGGYAVVFAAASLWYFYPRMPPLIDVHCEMIALAAAAVFAVTAAAAHFGGRLCSSCRLSTNDAAPASRPPL
jgi:hypothetical protein